MKAVLEIPDSRAPFMMELLGNFPFVKVQPLDDGKELLMNEIKEAVENVKLAKKGVLQPKSAKELLDEI